MASNPEPKKPQHTEMLGSAGCEASTQLTKLNIKRGVKKKMKSGENLNSEMSELGRTEVDTEVMACIDITSLQMEKGLDQEKAITTAAATKPGGETQHLDTCTMEPDIDPLCENLGVCMASVNDEPLKSIVEDIQDSVLSQNEGHSIEWDKVPQRVDSQEIDMDPIDEVMLMVSSSNDGSQKVSEDLGVDKEMTQVKDNVGVDTSVKEPGQNRDIIESKTTEHEQPEEVVGLDAIDSEAVDMGDTDHAAKEESQVGLKRKRGRPPKKQTKPKPQSVSNEEILKLLPEDGSYEFTEQTSDVVTVSYGVKCLVLCTLRNATARKYVLDNGLMIFYKLLKSESEVIIGNSALILGSCFEQKEACEQLVGTSIVKDMLTVATNEELSKDVKHNTAIAIAKLVKSDQRFLEQLRELHGLEILHSVIK